jgi:hypothetical protein
MKFSILICTIPSRFSYMQRLWGILAPQLTPEVEVLWMGDNKQRSIGAKRNELLRAAVGEFLAFVDDDDRPAEDYVEVLLQTMWKHSSVDVITFTQMVSVPGRKTKPCHYGVELEYHDGPDLWTGKPAHTMVWRSSVAKLGSFTDKSQGEDVDWVAQVWPLVKTQVRLDNVLYHYDYDPGVSERP